MAFVLAKRNGKYLENIEYFVCDGEDDLANLPPAPAGSTAHCIAEGTDYLLGSDGTWAKQPQGGGGGGGGDVEVEGLSVTENGTYTAQAGKAYSPVEVDVPNSYTPADEGKVVDDGALTAQTSLTVTANDTYDTTLVSSVTVNVGGDPPDPTDGKTHIWISMPDDWPVADREFNLRFKQSANNAVTVDWGDGTTPESWTGTSASNRSHTYAQAGDYEITMECESGQTYEFVGSTSNAIYGTAAYNYNSTLIKRIYIGDRLSASGIGDYFVNKCYALESVNLPSGITSIGASAFATCSKLKKVSLPSGITSIGSGAFGYCYALERLTIPHTVTDIANTAFQSCYSMIEYHFQSTTPPTLGGTSVFSSIPAGTKIYVPYSADHSVLEAYKTATNWSTHASKMVEEPA